MVSATYDITTLDQGISSCLFVSFWRRRTDHSDPSWLAHDTYIGNTYILITDDETMICETIFHATPPSSI
jgi:hypothetical protein